MDEEAASGLALGFVALVMAAFLGVALASRTGLGPLSLGIVVVVVATAVTVAASESSRR